jgi:hypothetical protein
MREGLGRGWQRAGVCSGGDTAETEDGDSAGRANSRSQQRHEHGEPDSARSGWSCRRADAAAELGQRCGLPGRLIGS